MKEFTRIHGCVHFWNFIHHRPSLLDDGPDIQPSFVDAARFARNV
ncbi:MAG: hypothetical protein ACLFQL_04245 [Paracoccaceae bacterium]